MFSSGVLGRRSPVSGQCAEVSSFCSSCRTGRFSHRYIRSHRRIFPQCDCHTDNVSLDCYSQSGHVSIWANSFFSLSGNQRRLQGEWKGVKNSIFRGTVGRRTLGSWSVLKAHQKQLRLGGNRTGGGRHCLGCTDARQTWVTAADTCCPGGGA